MSRTDPDRATVDLVRQRDGGCVRCGRTVGLSTQHRIARGMGGTRGEWVNRPSNLITLCGHGTVGCHGWVEHHPLLAKPFGWALSRFQDPATEPVLYPDGWWTLDDDGQRHPAPDPGGHGLRRGGGGGEPVDHPHLGQPWPHHAEGNVTAGPW